MKNLNHLLFLVFLLGCEGQETIHLRKKVIKKIYPGVVEVIVPKQEDEDIVYQRPLPFDQQDFKDRFDKYHAIGTAFFINNTRLISAAHVFPADEFSVHKNYFIRTAEGEIFSLNQIYRYSSYRDVIEFDLKTYPKSIMALKLQPKVEIGDMVYTVGNAQGEGISTRGGQVSTFTAEPVAGEWQFIRFSSPASPGNSGGPLVNSRGEVVGIIVMKNNSENLNYALPVSEIKNASLEKAHFFQRQMKVQDGMQVKMRDWTFFTPLPTTYSSLNSLAAPEKDRFYSQLIEDFKKEYSDLIFPHNKRFRDALLYQKLFPRMSMVDKDKALHDWRVDPINLKKIIVSKENILYHSKGEVFNHYALFKTQKGISSGVLFANPRLILNRMLLASGANRYMVGQSIPILDNGEPDESFVWRDRLGRPWRTSFWITLYNNTLLASHCTPSPEGVYCFFDQTFASQRLEGYMTFVKENILEINLSYSGTPDQWIQYQTLDKELKPTLFSKLEITQKNDHLFFRLPQLSFKTPALKNHLQSRISALVNYDPSQNLGQQIQGWEILINRNKQQGLTFFKTYEVQELAPDNAIERWQEIKNKHSSYDGKIHPMNNQLVKKIPVTPMLKSSYLRGEESKEIDSQWWLSCYGPNTLKRKAIDTMCNSFKSGLSFN
ncbi:MAG: trypsin-like peptidase domain-containing protein [Bacteriovoracaceae bacterium]|nr:trypsin-like peptidase domain-containing protein [Bacteriovoracaceae bacterium]